MIDPPPAAPTSPLRLNPHLLLALAVSFWAGNAVVGRAVHEIIPPVGLAFWRWLVAFLLVLPFSWRHLRADWALARRTLPIILLLSFLGITLFNTLLYTALRYTTALNATLLQSAMPVFVVAYSFLFFRDGMSRYQVLGMLLSLAGALTIVTRGNLGTLASFSFNSGDLLVLIAVVTYAAYTALLRLRPPVHGLTFLALTFGLGAAMLLPMLLWEQSSGLYMPFNGTSLAAVGYVALFPSILSYLFFNSGVERIGANSAGIFIHLNPVIASILAVALLDERFEWYHPAGFGLILTGIILVARRRARR